MNQITVKNIIDVTKGMLVVGNENMVCEEYSKDTRTIKQGDTYLAIRGASFDGNIFWKEAIEKGAQAVIINDDVEISEEEIKEVEKQGNAIIKVKDTIEALQQIAAYKRSLYNIPIIAITGSVGKTSTKDLIASVLQKKYKVLKTEGNNNNDIGMPLTLLRLKDHEIAIIEIGMNHLGEISRLSKIAKPTTAIITNVGSSHIGNLGSRENILKAKLEILDGMDTKRIVVNNDNDLLHKWFKENNQKIEIITYGIENKSDIEATNINEMEQKTEFLCNIENNQTKIEVPVPGRHFVYNALCAITIGKLYNVEPEKMQEGISQTELTKKRMEIIKLKNGTTIINDSYNSSYESTKAALEYIGNRDGKRKIAVLGDMLELGDFSDEYHKKVGLEVAKNKIDILICSGKVSKNIAEEAEKQGMDKSKIFYEENNEAVKSRLLQIMSSDDEILVKASQGMKFFKIVEDIVNEYNK